MELKESRFWKTKSLNKMTKAEWEALCDHCGVCCLHTVRNGKTGKIRHLAVACRYLDTSTCRCEIYDNRNGIEPDCERLAPDKIRRIKQLPYTCAYRALVEGRELEWWHPLVSGDSNTVHDAGISVQGKVMSGVQVDFNDVEYFKQ